MLRPNWRLFLETFRQEGHDSAIFHSQSNFSAADFAIAIIAKFDRRAGDKTQAQHCRVTLYCMAVEVHYM